MDGATAALHFLSVLVMTPRFSVSGLPHVSAPSILAPNQPWHPSSNRAQVDREATKNTTTRRVGNLTLCTGRRRGSCPLTLSVLSQIVNLVHSTW